MNQDPNSPPPPPQESFDWDGVVNQIFEILGTNTAILGKYGLVLSSRIKEFETGRLISPMIWDLIQNRSHVSKELGVQSVSSLVLETDIGNIVITFGNNIYLVSINNPQVDLAQLLPHLNRFLSTLDKGTDTQLHLDIAKLDLMEEYQELNRDKSKYEDKFAIFKELIKHMAR
jgi:predicted regulator of Ras-like GTPase activity (Roadblock/LC7/MglB family)